MMQLKIDGNNDSQEEIPDENHAGVMSLPKKAEEWNGMNLVKNTKH